MTAITTLAPPKKDHMNQIASAEQIIDAARNGRMVILIDDETDAGEGDLIIPAQMATPDAINFMARHGRGLVCLALTGARVAQLGLSPMGGRDHGRERAAFTTSIEAASGVSTGISAADRARTIAVAIDADCGEGEIVSPGHVFPLCARDGGMLVRAGHTEAAVDIARLAGLNPAGVICQIMGADGAVARMPELAALARDHDLLIGTMRDLIAYRHRHDRLVRRVSEAPFRSNYGGEWRMITYRSAVDGSESFALTKGEISAADPTLVRVHNPSVFADLLGEPGPREHILQRAMTHIGEAGAGVIVLFPFTSSEMPAGLAAQGEGAAERRLAYGIGAQILADLGVVEMILLSSSPHAPLRGIEGFGIHIAGERFLA